MSAVIWLSVTFFIVGSLGFRGFRLQNMIAVITNGAITEKNRNAGDPKTSAILIPLSVSIHFMTCFSPVTTTKANRPPFLAAPRESESEHKKKRTFLLFKAEDPTLSRVGQLPSTRAQQTSPTSPTSHSRHHLRSCPSPSSSYPTNHSRTRSTRTV